MSSFKEDQSAFWIQSRPVNAFQMNTYVVGSAHQAILIDAGGGLDWVQLILKQQEAELAWILQTHAHIDHVAALGEARRLWPLAKIALLQEEREHYNEAHLEGLAFGIRIPALPKVDHWLHHESLIHFGNLSLKVLSTPGHTAGSACFWCETHGVLWSGDTLFAGSIGRTDLPGGNRSQLNRSLRNLISWLPNQTRILPGHGPETSMLREKRLNPFLTHLK